MALFEGSGVALVTPFNSEGKIDYDVLSDLVQLHLENSTDAIIVCGTTGEASTLTDEEQIACIKFVVEKVAGKIPVIAGAGSNNTEHGIYLAVESKKVGVDGLLIATPYYNKTTQKGLVEHYRVIADAVDDLPIILYNIPGRTGLNITPATVYELSKISNIIGIKEASGNISQVAEIAAICGPNFDIYSGNDDQILPLLSLGGKGVISVAANILPKQLHDLCYKFFEGDFAGSLKLQLDMLNLINTLFIEVNPIPIKAAMEFIGYEVGRGRMPLTTMEHAHVEKLKEEMIKYGIILKK
jgi:4-hydroxy-tetrahydrodipicolinate synthase